MQIKKMYTIKKLKDFKKSKRFKNMYHSNLAEVYCSLFGIISLKGKTD